MDEITIDRMRKRIYNESSSVYYTSEVKEIITKNSIKITENINGIFLNLSLLNDIIIKELYYAINNQNESEEEPDILYEEIEKEEDNISIIDKPKEKTYMKFKLTSLQRKIIKSILQI